MFNFLISESSPPIDITEPCRYPVAVGIEKEYIPDQNIWATTQTNIARGPAYARLNGYKGKANLERSWLNLDIVGIDMSYMTLGRTWGNWKWILIFLMVASPSSERIF